MPIVTYAKGDMNESSETRFDHNEHGMRSSVASRKAC
jgi:hypothetical protein